MTKYENYLTKYETFINDLEDILRDTDWKEELNDIAEDIFLQLNTVATWKADIPHHMSRGQLPVKRNRISIKYGLYNAS